MMPTVGFSKSPSKPARFYEHLQAKAPEVMAHVNVARFEPLEVDDFKLAHTDRYVDGFFAGDEKVASSNGLRWSPEFAETVRYTNGSLVWAVHSAIAYPERIAMSPTSGFHHARPSGGSGFCTFSGQVISALWVYRNHGKVGAWIDLDGHQGNSIEDSRAWISDLDLAIPRDCNLNPSGAHADYLVSLTKGLAAIGKKVLAGEVHYVCFAHGADSHEWDDLGGQVTTGEWLTASRLVYESIRSWSQQLGRPVPVVLALFGGYRDDSPESVLDLHVADLAIALRILAGAEVTYEPTVVEPKVKAWRKWLDQNDEGDEAWTRRERARKHRKHRKHERRGMG